MNSIEKILMDDSVNIMIASVITTIITVLGSTFTIIHNSRKNHKKYSSQLTESSVDLKDFTEKINNKLSEMNKRIETIDERADIAHNDLEKEILRLQLLEGINSGRLSESEVAYFYDKYKAAGGNSFVSEKVTEYLENINQKGGSK